MTFSQFRRSSPRPTNPFLGLPVCTSTLDEDLDNPKEISEIPRTWKGWLTLAGPKDGFFNCWQPADSSMDVSCAGQRVVQRGVEVGSVGRACLANPTRIYSARVPPFSTFHVDPSLVSPVSPGHSPTRPSRHSLPTTAAPPRVRRPPFHTRHLSSLAVERTGPTTGFTSMEKRLHNRIAASFPPGDSRGDATPPTATTHGWRIPSAVGAKSELSYIPSWLPLSSGIRMPFLLKKKPS